MKSTVNISAGVRNGNTYLRDVYFTPPFKIVDTKDGLNGHLQLMIMNASPGTMNGDEYFVRIKLEKSATVILKTQSYQRLLQMKEGASQIFEVDMNEGSRFTFLSHPIVPHLNSDYKCYNQIHLSSGCNLLWGEVFTCGRKLNGEAFCFSSFHSITEITLNGKLVVKENLLIKPSQANILSIGQMEGYTHQSTLIFMNETPGIKTIIERTRTLLSTIGEIEYGVSELPVNGLIIRMLGYKAEQLFDLNNQLASLIMIEMSECQTLQETYV